MFDQLHKQRYPNIETFRKSGQGLKTCLVVQDGDIILVHIVAKLGKLERVRHNGQVNIAPCKMDCSVLDGWTTATEHEGNGNASLKDDKNILQKHPF
jgi:hypothetical protein